MMPNSKNHKSSLWGLLVTALALGGVLVATSLGGFLSTRNAVDSVVQARSMDIWHSVHRSLRTIDLNQTDALEDILLEMEPSGLRFIWVKATLPRLDLQVGQTMGNFGTVPYVTCRQKPRIQIDWSASRIRVVSGLGKRCGRPMPGRGRYRRARFPRHFGPGPAEGLLVVEFEPLVAKSMLSQTAWSLAISLVVALVLMVLALVFHRLSRRAESMQKELQHKSRLALVGEMSAVLGHELRNPLASVKGHTQLLLEKLGKDHPGYEKASRVLKETQRLEDLSNQILDFVRTGDLSLQPTSFRNIVQNALDDVGREGIKVNLPEDLPELLLDAQRMRQVLVNLLQNARLASADDQEVELTVSLDKDALECRIEDRGEGFSKESLKKAFDPFYTERARGSGLGLTLAKQIVTGHKGTILAENREAGGAALIVRLPRNQ